ncbi:MAG: HEAT repeat domain-containing protein [Anaerolineales bacterium]|nr:HEAT repeat domain-containing protein [Anaerolineales bacterium]MCX7608257.1 HEAT repeat domain-containing protein [Anaerolineales bacterium]MDW8226754.1 HEAT repeat domain-containing protein [Anaerolineales bacterium]
MPTQIPLTEILQRLQDESRPFPARYLHHFSDLTPEDLHAVLDIWPRISVQRKLTFLEDLEDLAETDTLVSFEDLARALLTDQEAGVRTRAIRLLWECEDPHLIPVYLNLLKNDESEETRAAAASALGIFIYRGEIEELEPRLWHQVEDALLEAATQATSPLVRRRALEALGTSSRDEVPALIEAAYHRSEPEWIASALFAMGKSCDTRWEKQVLSQLHNPNLDIRHEAIRAAGELGLGSARRSLLDQLEDEEDLDIRHEIIWALSKIGGPGIREKFDEMLDAEMDDEEAEFLEDALDNLFFTEDMASFAMFDFEIDDEDSAKKKTRHSSS